MANKTGAYGTSDGGDSNFRRTWDRDAMAEKAKQRQAQEREEAKERHEAKMMGKSYRRRASTPEDLKHTEARTERIDWSKNIGKVSITSATANVGKRGRGAGAYCQLCDLTFKDNLQYVEHLNSKQHAIASGQSREVRRATVEEVRDRLRYLKRKADEARVAEVVDLDTRLARAKESQDRAAEEKRQIRNQKRRSKAKENDNIMKW